MQAKASGGKVERLNLKENMLNWESGGKMEVEELKVEELKSERKKREELKVKKETGEVEKRMKKKWEKRN